jgi:hypothetical protein
MDIDPQIDMIRDRVGDAFVEEAAIADRVMSDPISNDDGDVPIDEASALGPARHIEMTIIAQDPSVRDEDGQILRSRVRVAADRFRQPLQTHRFHVVSYDPGTAGPASDFKLVDDRGRFRDRFARSADRTLITRHDFHAQNVFAIASRTLAAFEAALGRRVPWDFDSHQLYLIPHGEIRANAYYSASKRALVFGYVPGPDGEIVYSCLSHDIIAHETSHAILDGLRPGFFTPGLPDQGGFHEGFADVVALLSVFSVPAVAERALGAGDMGGVVTRSDVTRRKLMNSIVLQLAEQFGESVHGRHGRPLRESVNLRPGGWWRTEPGFREVHNRGEILVAAVGHALLDMWLGRLRELLRTGSASRRLAAEEGAKAAEHLLGMVIRAIDYCPPLEFEYEDFVDAILWSDRQVSPDDEHGYRASVVAGFARYDIGRPPQQIVEIGKLKVRPVYERFNFAALRSDKDEVFRFIWENDELLGISLDFETHVESVRSSVRVGPDGFVVQETVVTYIQQLDATARELRDLSGDRAYRYRGSADRLELPEGFDPGTRVGIHGGGAIIFDQFGRPKFHQHKPLLDWKRQTRRLAFLAEKAEATAAGTIGGRPYERGEPLAALHRPDRFEAERW